MGRVKGGMEFAHTVYAGESLEAAAVYSQQKAGGTYRISEAGKGESV